MPETSIFPVIRIECGVVLNKNLWWSSFGAIGTYSIILSPPDKPHKFSPTNFLSPLLGSPFHELGYLGASSWSQLQLIQPPKDDAQKITSKFERMEELLKDSGFNSVDEILNIPLHNPSCVSGESDLRGNFHAKACFAVSTRLEQGQNIRHHCFHYQHQHSPPSPGSLVTTPFWRSCSILSCCLSCQNLSCTSFIIHLGDKSCGRSRTLWDLWTLLVKMTMTIVHLRVATNLRLLIFERDEFLRYHLFEV